VSRSIIGRIYDLRAAYIREHSSAPKEIVLSGDMSDELYRVILTILKDTPSFDSEKSFGMSITRDETLPPDTVRCK
jgi:hypothetical protein